ncbi:MAG TPA: hypothetical protein VK858_09800 [Longimicrobiales bacterium]|nr:hypothetical protein [Longimicrobiales bacterium]
MRWPLLYLFLFAPLAGCDDPPPTDPLDAPLGAELIDPGDPDDGDPGSQVSIRGAQTLVNFRKGEFGEAWGSMYYVGSVAEMEVTIDVFDLREQSVLASRTLLETESSPFFGIPLGEQFMRTVTRQYTDRTCGVRLDGYTIHRAWNAFSAAKGYGLEWGRQQTSSQHSDRFPCSERKGRSRLDSGDSGCEECQQWLVYDTVTGTFLYDYWECTPVDDSICSTLL